MFISFTGHAEVYADIADKLSETIEECLKDTNEAVFFVGGRGEFDSMAASAVMAAKSRHEDKDIRLYLVEPYMSKRLNRDKEYYAQRYDEIIIPSELMAFIPKQQLKNATA